MKKNLLITMKRTRFILCLLLLAIAGMVQAQGKWTDAGIVATGFADGNGSAETPFIISSPGELAFLAKEVNGGNNYATKRFKLVPADGKDFIDLDKYGWVPIGNFSSRNSSTVFYGHFDGGGNTIRNIHVSGEYDYAGLFGVIADMTIKNLTLEGVEVQGQTTGQSNAGAFAGMGKGGNITFSHCYINGMQITGGSGGSITGGLLGDASDVNLTIESCAVRATVQGGGTVYSLTGGLVGSLYGSLALSDSYFDGEIRGAESVSGDNTTGGLMGMVGFNSTFSITNCYVTGRVIGGTGGDDISATGGLIGYGYDQSSITLKNCLAALDELSGPEGTAIRRIVGNKRNDATTSLTNTHAYTRTGNPINDNQDRGTDWNGNLSGEPVKTWNNDVWIKDPSGNTLPVLADITGTQAGAATGFYFIKGEGTEDNPYKISTPKQLDLVRHGLDKHYLLTDNIELDTYLGASTAPGAVYDSKGWLPIGTKDSPFQGSLDGDGYTISGLWIDREDTDQVGLFGYIAAGSIIKNLTVEIPDGEAVKGKMFVGGLVGTAKSPLKDCRVTGSGKVTGGDAIGGLVGYVEMAIDRCVAKVDVEGSNDVGGLVGVLHLVSAYRSYTTGEVTVTGDNGAGGGLAGLLTGGTLSQCYALGNVKGTGSSPKIGGLLGTQRGSITQCYAAGQVTATGGEIGGLSGERGNSRTITSSYYNTTANPDLNGVGNGAQDGVTGISSDKMQQRATFLADNWTFDKDNWSIDDGAAYPHFSWETWDGYIPPTPPDPAGYHTIHLELGAHITANYTAGDLTISENDHLYLDFQPDTNGATAADILFLVDGTETSFKTSTDGKGGSYILNSITKDHTIVIALHEYTVTLPEVDGATTDPATGEYKVAYGEPFWFTISLKALKALNDFNTLEAFKDLKVFANNIELSPDETGQAQSLQYTIDAITGPVTITIEGLSPTGNTPIITNSFSIYVSNGMLVADSPSATRLAVYTPAGQLYTARAIPVGTTRIALPQGIYIVQAGGMTWKITVND